ENENAPAEHRHRGRPGRLGGGGAGSGVPLPQAGVRTGRLGPAGHRPPRQPPRAGTRPVALGPLRPRRDAPPRQRLLGPHARATGGGRGGHRPGYRGREAGGRSLRSGVRPDRDAARLLPRPPRAQRRGGRRADSGRATGVGRDRRPGRGRGGVCATSPPSL
ncbi:MAG: hypothetical protein AVDCRST_MAG19-1200, partial [uncultured Thermomicrobiales bacterium]